MKTIARKNNNECGFTMVELLVAIAIFGILTAIAIPNIITFKKNAQLSAATRELFSGFQQAKMNAIKRNENCTISFNTSDYNYVVYLDDDGDFALDSDEKIIASQNKADSGNINVTPDWSTIVFTSQGLPEKQDGSAVSGDVELKTADSSRTIKVEMNILGNAKITS